MKNKYFYPIFKLKTKSWIRYWLLKKTEFKGKLSDILTGFSFNLQNTLRQKFVKFEIEGNSIQDGEPSPENEVPILSSGDNGSITEKIVTKNLLKITENTRLTRCTYVSGANTNQYKLLCTAAAMYFNEVQNVGLSWSIANGNLIPCKQGETLYFDVGNPLFTGCYFNEYDKNLKSLRYRRTNSSSGTYTPTNINCAFVTFRGGYNENAEPGTTYTLAPIVCKTSDTSYVSYEEQTYTIPVQAPFRSIGNVRDVFFKNTVDSPYYDENLVENGWYERHLRRIRLTSDMTITAGQYGVNTYVVTLTDNCKYVANTTACKSTHFRGVPYEDRGASGNNIIYTIPAGNKFEIRNTEFATIEAFKTFLDDNEVYVEYIPAEYINLLCTTEQTNILENIPSTFSGQTNVFSLDEVKAYLKIQYWESDTNG